MSDLLNLDLSSAQKSLKNREISSVELTKAYLDAIEKTSSLGAYIDLQKDYALEMAKNSDKKINQGVAGPLEGIPIGVKDMFCTKGIKTTASSKILENFYPTYESTVTQNLWNDGAVMLGKLSCDEFAMGSSNETAAKGNVINPWSKTIPMSPGGSSGGSAAAVASRSALAATGTDTGGSIRQPAAFCGITGLKPTYGRCSRWGIVAFSSSLDQAGPLTRTVSDAAIMLNSMAGYDNKDSTSANLEMPDLTSYLDKSIKGKKIGIPKEYTQDGISEDIVSFYETSIQFLKDSGAEIIPVSLPHTKYALPVYYIIAPAEASSNLARYDGVRYGTRKEAESLDDMYELTRGEGFGDEVQRRIMIGTYVLSSGYYDAYYLKAQKVRRLIKEDFDNTFENVDFLLTPSTPSTAFELGQKQDPLTMYLNDIFTVPASLAGLPGISIPVGLDKAGLPVGIQLIANSFDEPNLISVAHTLEKSANFNVIAQGAAK
ncbi:MAG: Asp-tRNA(Asn)/Glu-tRNA(Gln) amidotransferase subunit GatA [Alphaproteobacteria bacterium]|jgi:aspartyl-tRNA(Asn)/glutamyl-tRNA(Gln) amidotransferase subunit A|nr:Asp-tRNA(Asn)/Glu-tRNA(Gln) amidotransferase subunit GatA [Alphaproteobacteria bacterium]MDA9914663.1 Asp-tRNA(Asn)/Glu-tRNA(Gln) amidotransferase subunit GatA [Alphaproteobacteria bacterium]